MNADAYDRREARRITRLLASDPVLPPSSSAVRSSAPQHSGITATALRKKIRQLGPTASLIRLGGLHYICTIGRTYRFEGLLGDVYEEMKPLFSRLSIQ